MTIPLLQQTPNRSHEEQTETDYIKASLVESERVQPGFPPNFGEVVKGVYRSSFPAAYNLRPLKHLGLKTIITLVDEPYTPSHTSFFAEHGIKSIRIPVQANKDPAIKTSPKTINDILEILLNKANHPILIHCNKGKHRTGCVVACFRKLQGWNLDDVTQEYHKYAWPKARPLDLQYIEQFDNTALGDLALASGVKSWRPTGKYTDLEPESHDQSSPGSLTNGSC
ncbi:tyrosine-protein phosphatase siw14 [Aspergillus nanangensis]|uniref:diphosphoinositol-polyphosphate diphosphatase n=1 Tax=Aspergillus nanangensis TaxID=2582783 RepID=A0AAD4CJX3_ASPNN|nr:tyrosine-protein phosphatase siw14 [Aspergillus nanangensis]